MGAWRGWGGRVLAWLLEELGRMKAPCAGIPGVDGTGPPGAGYALQVTTIYRAYDSRTSPPSRERHLWVHGAAGGDGSWHGHERHLRVHGVTVPEEKPSWVDGVGPRHRPVEAVTGGVAKVSLERSMLHMNKNI